MDVSILARWGRARGYSRFPWFVGRQVLDAPWHRLGRVASKPTPTPDPLIKGRYQRVCGQRGGSMVPVGWAERPDDVLERISS